MGSTNRRSAKAIQARRRRNRVGMLIITFVVCILFTILFVEGIKLQRTLKEGAVLQQELQEEITAEEERFAAAESLREYVESEEYIKETAHTRLGLLMENEIIFKERDGQ